MTSKITVTVEIKHYGRFCDLRDSGCKFTRGFYCLLFDERLEHTSKLSNIRCTRCLELTIKEKSNDKQD